ncbi:MAG TPA: tetratricopeptide repeat protein [Streptosporangiaceae bacterium]|nr:tetratricopeptide repeat protein [Streptosporangiaceae bacterium]
MLSPADESRQLSDEWAHWLEAEVGPGAEQLLIALSVFREPADHNAIVFQLGRYDEMSALAPDRRGPVPPYQAPPGLPWLLAACREARVLTFAGLASDGHWQVSPEIASGLHQRLLARGRHGELTAAHRRAAAYWRWHAASWPQERRADVHDLLEARHHLFRAGDVLQACEITRIACAQLRAWGDLRSTAELVQDTLDALPDGSGAWADWMGALGGVYQEAGRPGEAQRCFTESIRMCSALGDYDGVARGQRRLAALAQAEGEYRTAERHYRRAAAADRKAAAADRTAADRTPANHETGASRPAITNGVTGNSRWPRAIATAARWHDGLRAAHGAAGTRLA